MEYSPRIRVAYGTLAASCYRLLRSTMLTPEIPVKVLPPEKRCGGTTTEHTSNYHAAVLEWTLKFVDLLLLGALLRISATPAAITGPGPTSWTVLSARPVSPHLVRLAGHLLPNVIRHG